MFLLSEHFPRLIEVYSDGKNEPLPHFAQEFITNGNFFINSQKVSVTRGRGMNVLNYDPVSGNYTFAVNYYPCKRSCGKAMFLHLSVILLTGGCHP